MSRNISNGAIVTCLLVMIATVLAAAHVVVSFKGSFLSFASVPLVFAGLIASAYVSEVYDNYIIWITDAIVNIVYVPDDV